MRIIQRQVFRTNTVVTGTTQISEGVTATVNTEGDEYLRMFFKPTSANSKLEIQASWLGSSSNGQTMIIALFQDAIVTALATQFDELPAANRGIRLNLDHEMPAGTTDEITLAIRVGQPAGATNYMNGVNGAIRFGGTMYSSLKVTEYEG